ncbi:MAG: tetratricopeptide repeat protein [Candidatus Hydrogenedentes bacterium]|nr:tetratricopeptide repeat protein [Candidatus Hydrogenedentota bacterium]
MNTQWNALETLWRRGVISCASAALAALLAAGCSTTDMARNLKTNEMLGDGTVIEYPSPNAKTLYATARLMISQGKNAQARSLLDRLINEHPSFLPAHSDLAKLYLQEGHVPQAQAALTRALEVAPNDPVLINNLGVTHLMQGHYQHALDQFTLAAENNPRETRYRANMALAMGMLGQYDESLALYNQVIGTDDAQHNLTVINDIVLGYQ